MTKKFVALVAIDHVHTIVQLLRCYHYDVFELLKNSNLPEDVEILNPDEFLVVERVEHLLAIIATKLTIAEQVELLSASAKLNVDKMCLGAEFSLCHSLQDALDVYFQTVPETATGSEHKLVSWLGENWLLREKQFYNTDWYPLSDTYVVAFLSFFMQRWLQPEWFPVRIQIQSDADHYIRQLFYKQKVEIFVGRKYTGIAIPDISTPVQKPNQVSVGTFDAADRAALRSFKMSVVMALKPYLADGRPSIEDAASICGMNVKMLQRKLKNEGLSYSELLNDLIFNQAIQKITLTDKSIADIALEVGYEFATHFTRAFKRRYGITPMAYRNKNRSSLK